MAIGQAPGGVVGAADITHLTLMHQVVQGAQRLFDGRISSKVSLVLVDIVRVETAQRSFDFMI
jgi:hypothetical protein